MLDAKIPAGPLADKWDTFKSDAKLVNPNNKRKFKVLVVGTGLAGASAAATLAELGYQVEAFTFHDSARRAHSIAAQGGINAAKNYRGDGDSIHRLFYDTIKGGDFRAREGNVYRLAQLSVNIIDQAVAQGVRLADVDVIAAYSIRPYTEVMDAISKLIADGAFDAEYIIADSEHSQFEIVKHASSVNARAFGGSSGTGWMYGFEALVVTATDRLPPLFLVGNRALDGRQPRQPAGRVFEPRRICAGDDRQHRQAGADEILGAVERQRPKVRRGPQEDDREQDQRLDCERAGRRDPADYRRQRARRAADDDVLRGRALQPHRVDHDIEEDREGQKCCGGPIDQQAECGHRKPGKHKSEGQRLAGLHAPGRNWPASGPRHHGIDVGVVPHVEGAGCARTHGDRQDRQPERGAQHGHDREGEHGDEGKAHADSRVREWRSSAGCQARVPAKSST